MIPIEKLSEVNFLCVCDVSMNIMEKLQMTDADNVEIRILPNIIQFKRLMPADSPNLRDEYCDNRAHALKYLKTNKFIIDYRFMEGMHRWDVQVKISLDQKVFRDFYTKLSDVYQTRVVDPQKELKDKNVSKIEFRFNDGVLYRDGMDVVLKFSEKTLEYNLLKVAFNAPEGTRIDCVTQGLDFSKFKQLSDTARRLNEKINIKFSTKDLFIIQYADQYIKRNNI